MKKKDKKRPGAKLADHMLIAGMFIGPKGDKEALMLPLDVIERHIHVFGSTGPAKSCKIILEETGARAVEELEGGLQCQELQQVRSGKKSERGSA